MKRVKSSLGKRSSSIGGQNSRVSDVNNASSRLSTNKKKSFLLQPGFSRNSRSNSMDTLNDGPLGTSKYDSKMGTSMFSSAKKPMQRSKSQVNLMTPSTPKNMSYMPSSMAMGSAKSAARSKMSLDNRDRMSSMGGRVSKKDTRPINDKAYIQEMMEKVQKLAILDPDCKSLMNNGKIRPMSTQLFIMLSEIVLQYFDPKLILNNGNYANEIPNRAKLFLYRGKLDKTMLITVSTPHTFPNVIAFLAWFVECQEMAKALSFEILFNEFNSEAPESEDQDDIDFGILIPYLATSHNYERNRKNHDHLTEELAREIRQKSVACEEYNHYEEEIKELMVTYEQLNAEGEAKNNKLLEVENEHLTLLRSQQEQDKYLVDTEEFLGNIEQQQKLVDHEFKITEDKIDTMSKETQAIRLTVKNQEMSLEDKEKLAMERAEIMREINILDAQSKVCNDVFYTEQMELSRYKNKVDSCIVKHNNDLYEHLNSLPDAQKELAIDINILDPQSSEAQSRVDTILSSLLSRLESHPEELEEKLVAVQSGLVKQDVNLKALRDELIAVNERLSSQSSREEQTKAQLDLELQAVEVEVKRMEREIEIISAKKPNVLDVEKQLLQKNQELEELCQLQRKYVERMKQRILALDNAYKEKVLAAAESQKRISAKRNHLKILLSRKK